MRVDGLSCVFPLAADIKTRAGLTISIGHIPQHISIVVALVSSLYVQAAEEYPSPPHIKHATFIFITGRWQGLSKETELIMKCVFYTAAENK